MTPVSTDAGGVRTSTRQATKSCAEQHVPHTSTRRRDVSMNCLQLIEINFFIHGASGGGQTKGPALESSLPAISRPCVSKRLETRYHRATVTWSPSRDE